MRILKTMIAAGLLLGTPALAQQAEPAGSGGISEAGATLYKNYEAKQREELVPLMKRRAELQAQFDGLMKPETFDDAKLEQTMIALRQVEGEIVAKRGEGLLALLRAMNEADRNAFLKSMVKAPPAAASNGPIPAGPGR